MSEAQYGDPEKFRPERFEGFPLSTREYMHTSHRDYYSFGAGRRQVDPFRSSLPPLDCPKNRSLTTVLLSSVPWRSDRRNGYIHSSQPHHLGI
jgi:hypothetical protein